MGAKAAGFLSEIGGSDWGVVGRVTLANIHAWFLTGYVTMAGYLIHPFIHSFVHSFMQ